MAGYHDVEDVGNLYGLCAELHGYYATKGNELSEGQAREAKGMLVICPNFPKAKTVRANIGQGSKADREREQGIRFGDGSYRVGKTIRPGRYFVKHGDGCYWERLDRRGNIIANNFVNADTRVEVTIRSSDYTFSSENCGEWSRA